MTFSLLYLARPTLGGWVTFTVHLANYLRELGAVNLYKAGARLEGRGRDFGWGLAYQNIPIEAFDALENKIITALDKNFYHCVPKLAGSWLVLHDPTELKPDIIRFLPNFKIITIRKQMHDLLLEKYKVQSTNINHPFWQYSLPPERERTEPVAISRIDFDKHTEIILGANKMLEGRLSARPVKIFGTINPIYEFHKLKGMELRRYWGGEFGKSFWDVANILAGAKMMIDMSAIKNDGAGTQYTFLEAIHSGVPLVLNRKWFENGKEVLIPGENCFAVGSAEELYEFIVDFPVGVAARVAERAREILTQHRFDGAFLLQ